MTALVEVNNISKSFESFLAVDDINFSLEKGEVLGFLGPNGAGKTTTMRILTGFLKPSLGSIKINGLDLFKNKIDVNNFFYWLISEYPKSVNNYKNDPTIKNSSIL